MSIQYCYDCDKQIDTDFNAEHFIQHDEDLLEAGICPDCKEERIVEEHQANGPDDYDKIAVCQSCGSTYA